MPPEQIETDITGRFERFFTLGSGIDHIESRSLPGVSLIKVYFQPGTNADSAVTTISNLAMANLRRLPPGTLPPVVLKFDASSLPVCLITLKGEGLNETPAARPRPVHRPQPAGERARRVGAAAVRRQVPADHGLRRSRSSSQAHQLSLMDVVRAVNASNLILPAGDVKIGPFDYNIYTNSQLRNVAGHQPVPAQDGRQRLDGARRRRRPARRTRSQIQTNIVRVDGQRSVYLPVLKQGGDTNTIAVVNGIKDAVSQLLDVPTQLVHRRRLRPVAVREERHRDTAPRRARSGWC